MRARAACAVALALLSALPAHGLASHPLKCPVAGVEPAAAPRPIALPAGTRVGVALGSGSMHGLAHVGVIQELEARGLPVHVVSGTSVGALVGALWASGLDAREIDALARSEAFEDLSAFSGSWQGLFSNERLRAPLEAAFKSRPIERWPRRFGAVATNVANGERRLIVSGSGATAVQASSAVPMFYRPVVVQGERLVDGALVEPVPVLAARDLGADFVIGIDVAYRPHEEEASGLSQYAFQALHILVNSLAAQQLATASIAIRLNVHRRFMECGREALIEAGREGVRRAWPEIAAALQAQGRR